MSPGTATAIPNPRRRFRFRALYLTPLLALIALTAWAFASPVGSSPDDDFHLVSAWCAEGLITSECEEGTAEGNRVVPEGLVEVHCYRGDTNVSASCQEAEFDITGEPTELTTRGNFAGGYPPLYYTTMNLFVGDNIAVSAVIMRMINVLLFVGLNTALFVLVAPKRRFALVWGWAITTVPLGLFLISSNNPSAWSIIGVGTLWIALLGFLEERGRRRIPLGAIVVIAGLMSAGSRADSAVYGVMAMGAVLILTFEPTRRFLLSALLPAAMSGIALLYFLGSRQSNSGISGFEPAYDAPREVIDPFTLAVSNFLDLPKLWVGVFGTDGLGWRETFLPAIVTFGAASAFVAIVFLGIRQTWARKTAVLLIGAAVLWLLPVYVLGQGTGSQVVGEQVQPRYLLPLIALFAGLALLTRFGSAVRLSMAQRITVVGLLSVAQFVALHQNMRRYITGMDNRGLNLNNGIEWWWDIPVSPMAVLLVGSAAYVALLWILARATAVQRSGDSVTDGAHRTGSV